MGTIVVGYDGTEGADEALAEAATLARELGDRLVLVFAFEINRLGGEIADYAAALREYGRGVLERGRASGVLGGLDVEVREVEQAPADALVAVADEVDARMIVTGSYGERPLKGAIVGSTPYRLMHLSDRPVLVVRVPQS